MQNQEFLSEVQRRIGAASGEEAARATRAVLETLADHLAGNAPAKLAAQLPEEIGAFITEHKSDPEAEGEGFGTEEFIRRAATGGAAEDLSCAKRFPRASSTRCAARCRRNMTNYSEAIPRRRPRFC